MHTERPFRAKQATLFPKYNAVGVMVKRDNFIFFKQMCIISTRY